VDRRVFRRELNATLDRSHTIAGQIEGRELSPFIIALRADDALLHNVQEAIHEMTKINVEELRRDFCSIVQSSPENETVTSLTPSTVDAPALVSGRSATVYFVLSWRWRFLCGRHI
jgi:hypothetical protein